MVTYNFTMIDGSIKCFSTPLIIKINLKNITKLVNRKYGYVEFQEYFYC